LQVHPITASKKAIATSGQNGDEVEDENDVQEESAAEEVATVVAGSQVPKKDKSSRKKNSVKFTSASSEGSEKAKDEKNDRGKPLAKRKQGDKIHYAATRMQANKNAGRVNAQAENNKVAPVKPNKSKTMSRDSVADVKIHEVNGKEVRDLLAGLGLSQSADSESLVDDHGFERVAWFRRVEDLTENCGVKIGHATAIILAAQKKSKVHSDPLDETPIGA